MNCIEAIQLEFPYRNSVLESYRVIRVMLGVDNAEVTYAEKYKTTCMA